MKPGIVILIHVLAVLAQFQALDLVVYTDAPLTALLVDDGSDAGAIEGSW